MNVSRLFFLLLCLNLAACDSSQSTPNNAAPNPNNPVEEPAPEPTPSASRTFKMGFTPWLYEASFAAQDLVYEGIQNNGDIISHHLMAGIPWQEAYDQSTYPQAIEDDIATRLAKTNAQTTVYLSIDSLNGLRTELAPNWGLAENEPRTGDWATRSFDSPEVITAYTNFAIDMIDRFEPDYFNYGVEVSVLMFDNPTGFDAFVDFAEAVYARIKLEYPDLPMLVSLSLKTPNNAEMQIVKDGFVRIADFVDVAGISVYPYAFYDHLEKGDPANMPEDWLRQISELAPNKAIAITEVGWAAEDFVLPSFGIDLPITEEDQNRFLETLFLEANEQQALFVIWFCLYDYDTLWNSLLGQGDVARIWRDIGLYDEALEARPSLQTWQAWFDRILDD